MSVFSVRALVLAAIVSSAGTGAVAGDLEVVVQGAQPGEGKVRVGVFESDAFPDTPLRGREKPADGQGRVRVHFTGLEPGEYAVSAYQDRSGSGELDTNFVGAPTEPFGFSQGAQSRFGPPDFEEAMFSLNDSFRRIEVTLEE